MPATSYTLSATTEHDFADAVELVRGELASEGFGVLSEIDVQATLKIRAVLSIVDNGALAPIAADVRQRLARVVSRAAA